MTTENIACITMNLEVAAADVQHVIPVLHNGKDFFGTNIGQGAVFGIVPLRSPLLRGIRTTTRCRLRGKRLLLLRDRAGAAAAFAP